MIVGLLFESSGCSGRYRYSSPKEPIRASKPAIKGLWQELRTKDEPDIARVARVSHPQLAF